MLRLRRGDRPSTVAPAAGTAGAGLGLLGSSSPVPILTQVSPLVWVMVAIAAGGAIVTYAFLVYAVWRFRDPSTRKRNYG